MNSEEREERLQEIIAGYLEAEESGRPPDRGELLARHPEWQAELELFLSNREKLAHAFGELGGMEIPSLPKSEREISTLSSPSAKHAAGAWLDGNRRSDRPASEQSQHFGGKDPTRAIPGYYLGVHCRVYTKLDTSLALRP